MTPLCVSDTRPGHIRGSIDGSLHLGSVAGSYPGSRPTVGCRSTYYVLKHTQTGRGDSGADDQLRVFRTLDRVRHSHTTARDGLDAVPGRDHEARHVPRCQPREQLDGGRLSRQSRQCDSTGEPGQRAVHLDGRQSHRRHPEYVGADPHRARAPLRRVRPLERLLGRRDDAVLLACEPPGGLLAGLPLAHG